MAASRNGSDPSRSLQPEQIFLARILLAVPQTGPSADTSTLPELRMLNRGAAHECVSPISIFG